MAKAGLEHVNVTVSDPQRTAAMLRELFDWQIRWEGDSIHEGYSMHVGTDRDYVAIYAPKATDEKTPNSYTTLGGLNHIGITVDDIDATEARVKAAGYEPHAHADYEPGRRFYFDDQDGIEWEVVSYA
ncbi:MAG: VOC family protein [Pseudomonadota bacterium]